MSLRKEKKENILRAKRRRLIDRRSDVARTFLGSKAKNKKIGATNLYSSEIDLSVYRSCPLFEPNGFTVEASNSEGSDYINKPSIEQILDLYLP